MVESSTVYQRSEEGRNEIVRRLHNLTQSERLTLILTDGVCSAKEVRARLKALTDERFERDMKTLLALELIGKMPSREIAGANATLAENGFGNAPEACPKPDALAPVTLVRSDPNFDFTAFAETISIMTPTLCPTASTALALQEWSKRRGWHIGASAPKNVGATSAGRPSGKRRAISMKMATQHVMQLMQPPTFGQRLTCNVAHKRLPSTAMLFSVAVALTGTLAFLR